MGINGGSYGPEFGNPLVELGGSPSCMSEHNGLLHAANELLRAKNDSDSSMQFMGISKLQNPRENLSKSAIREGPQQQHHQTPAVQAPPRPAHLSNSSSSESDPHPTAKTSWTQTPDSPPTLDRTASAHLREDEREGKEKRNSYP